LKHPEIKWVVIFLAIFLLLYFLPTEFTEAPLGLGSGLAFLQEYAREHVLLCLLPALFIAGAITVLVRKESIIKYLGGEAHKALSYAAASVSGTVLAVCSCTVLPLFAGIRQRGAGLGPAVTFLFSGPAINIAAIFLTFSVLGYSIGLARIVAAIGIAVLVGVTMALLFREKPGEGAFINQDAGNYRASLLSSALLFASLLAILIVNALPVPLSAKYGLGALLMLCAVGVARYGLPSDTSRAWLAESWQFTKTLMPYLVIGVFVAGVVMAFLPETVITSLVGSNSLTANLFAAVFGAFMYFSTLTEVPILHALTTKGMAAGPALALLLAGPSLSLPNMLVIRRVLGTKKTAVYVVLVIIYSAAAGLFYGWLVG
jgi:uncharacterized protein